MAIASMDKSSMPYSVSYKNDLAAKKKKIQRQMKNTVTVKMFKIISKGLTLGRKYGR